MKILFDEDVPQKLARYFPRHEIHTVVSMESGGIKTARCSIIEPHLDKISLAIDAARRGTLHIVDCGEFVPRGKRTGE